MSSSSCHNEECVLQRSGKKGERLDERLEKRLEKRGTNNEELVVISTSPRHLDNWALVICVLQRSGKKGERLDGRVEKRLEKRGITWKKSAYLYMTPSSAILLYCIKALVNVCCLQYRNCLLFSLFLSTRCSRLKRYKCMEALASVAFYVAFSMPYLFAVTHSCVDLYAVTPLPCRLIVARSYKCNLLRTI